MDIVDALREVRLKIGNGGTVGMLWDNARIHRSRLVSQYIDTPEIDMAPVWNCTARPDAATRGIEECWARAKYLYRIEVDRLKALNRPFSNMGLVQSVLGSLDNDLVKRLASHSVPAVMAMQPIQPLQNELTRGDARATFPQYIHHSP